MKTLDVYKMWEKAALEYRVSPDHLSSCGLTSRMDFYLRLILTSSTIDKKLEIYIKLEIELEIYRNNEYGLETKISKISSPFSSFLSMSSLFSSFL